MREELAHNGDLVNRNIFTADLIYSDLSDLSEHICSDKSEYKSDISKQRSFSPIKARRLVHNEARPLIRAVMTAKRPSGAS